MALLLERFVSVLALPQHAHADLHAARRPGPAFLVAGERDGPEAICVTPSLAANHALEGCHQPGRVVHLGRQRGERDGAGSRLRACAGLRRHHGGARRSERQRGAAGRRSVHRAAGRAGQPRQRARGRAAVGECDGHVLGRLDAGPDRRREPHERRSEQDAGAQRSGYTFARQNAAAGQVVLAALAPSGVCPGANGLDDVAVTIRNTALASIDVIGDSVPMGLEVAFFAVGHYADGSSHDLTRSIDTRDTGSAAIATVQSGGAHRGRVTGVAVGTTPIVATQGLRRGPGERRLSDPHQPVGAGAGHARARTARARPRTGLARASSIRAAASPRASTPSAWIELRHRPRADRHRGVDLVG